MAKNPEFGGADVQAPACDHCGEAIRVIALRGRRGRYCSQECCTIGETEMEEKTVTAEETSEKQVVKASSKKKPAKKAVKAPKEKLVKKPAKKANTEDSACGSFRQGTFAEKLFSKFLAEGKPAQFSVMQKWIEDQGFPSAKLYQVMTYYRKAGVNVVVDRKARTAQVSS